MPESREPHSVLDLAEQALAAGDYSSAEHFLREAARLTEAESGPLSPYLANTLNNLGVVSEMQNNADEAEVCYRRAYEIAAATLPPDHPFVATSLKNLSDLCAARGKPIEAAALPRVEVPPPAPALEAPAGVVETPPPPRELPPPPPRTVPSRPSRAASSPSPRAVASAQPPRRSQSKMSGLALAAGAVVLAGILGAMFAMRGQPESSAAQTGSPTPALSQKSEPPVTAEPVAPTSTVASKPEPAETNREPNPPAAAVSGAPAVITARLCRSLNRSSSAPDDWPCEAATGQVAAGTLFFYTRLKALRDTEVEHRWYRGDDLYQSVELPVRANQTKGFRTYSRYTIKDGGSGNWRVELRSNDGRLLHKEQITVR